MTLISHADPRLSWHGAVSMEQTATYSRPWRILFEQRSLYYPMLAARGATQAGVRLAFHSSTGQVAGRILPLAENQNLDLFVDGCFVATADLANQTEFRFEGLGREEKLIELWLPQRGDFALEHLQIDDDATLRPYEDRRPKWITYGSSITHCGSAHSPSKTWPAIVARERSWNLTCLGYGGQCHLDIQIARMMRDMPADYLSICAGINIYGKPTLNERTFRSSLIGFVQILREKHRETPLLLISPIYSAPREETPNPQGWTLGDYRTAVEEAVQLLRENGDRNVHYLSGLKIADHTLHDRMPDQLHPDGDGCIAMGANFLLNAAPILAGER